jgi:tetratricopeptide (TPR) repeat protein
VHSGKNFSSVFSGPICLLLLMAAVSAATRAQFGPRNPNPVVLVVHVYVDSLSNPAPANLTVQLLDSFGSREREAHTDGSGRVEFQTTTVTKGLRIYGPGIQEYNEILEIESVESHKTANIVVKAARSGASTTGANSSSAGMVGANRLNVPGKAHKEFEKGSEALGKKAWAEAKKHFDAAIALYANYDVAYNGLGVALMSVGDSRGARPAFEKAIHLNEDFAEAYRNLAKIALDDHNYEEVDTLLSRSLSSDPLNAWALAYAAYAELQLHKFDETIAHARKAHTVPHATLASVHIVCGRALEAKQQSAEAIAEYRAYLSEDPSGRDAARARQAIARLTSTAPK